ncbi:MAG: SDR family NAD(P)-dependent oxidoreductase, partial [Pseudomonadota bacterium]|nr:SDR family NAD(P)-dependent oxidoreductase [Pseudomonadota bacterium]
MAQPPTLLLTGASRGIGHSTVQFFSAKGWRIITCSRDTPPTECRRDPNWSHHLTADLGDPAALDAFIAEANSLIGDGGLQGLVNNAG